MAMDQQSDDLQKLKRVVRARADANRRRQQDKDRLSRVICAKLAALPQYAAAGTVMFYVDVRDEVRTRHFFPQVRQQGKRIVVPYCVGDRLGLFLLESIDELAAGTFGILEPKSELRQRRDRAVEPEAIDLIVVPGVAFDRRGGRLGHGRGYYDRLLERVRPDTALVALAFACQLFAEVPLEPHDVTMDVVITEEAIYRNAASALDRRAGGR